MKGIIPLILLIIFLIACNPKEEIKVLSEKVNLTTEDDVNIIARHYKQDSNKGIILIHMYGKDRESWNSFAKELQNLKYNVISLDLRGHGESDLDLNLFQEKDFNNMVKDVEAAHKYLEDNNIFQISIIGASIGANIALNYAAQEPKIQKIVLLSPGLNYKGIKTGEAIKQYNRPLLIITGKQDTYSRESSEKLYNASPSKKELKIYDTTQHGTNIINKIPSSKELVKEFIQKN